MDLGAETMGLLEKVFGPVIGVAVFMGLGLWNWWRSTQSTEAKSQAEARETLTEAQEAMFSRLQSEVDTVRATKESLKKERDHEHRWSLWHRALAEAHHRNSRELWHKYNNAVHRARILRTLSGQQGDSLSVFPDIDEPPDIESMPTRGATRPPDQP